MIVGLFDSRRFKIAVTTFVGAALFCTAVPVPVFADTQSDLAAAKEQLAKIGAEYQSLSSELEQAGADLEETNAEIEQTKDELAEAQKALTSNVQSEYKSGGIGLMQMVLSSVDFNDLISNIFYANKINDAHVEAINRVRELQDQLKTQKEEQQAKLDNTQQKVDEQAQNQADALALVNSLSSQVKAELEEEAKKNESLAAGMQSAEDGELVQSSNFENAPVAGTNGNASNQITDSTASNSKEDGSDSQKEESSQSQSKPSSNASSSKPSSNGGSSSNSSSSSSSTSGSTISSPISYALAMAGAPYVSGGESMAEGGFDCSGLVYYAYRQIGITLPRTASAQCAYFKNNGRFTTNKNELQYGDVVFFSGHVAFYVGNGQVFGARRPGVPASTTSMSYFPGFKGGGQLYT